ncbi:hypothetical protein ACFLQV_04110 [Calditrichota bacterium]
MRTIILRIVLFFTLFTLLSVGISELFSRYVMADSNLSRTERQLFNFDRPMQIISIGDSHPRSALIPDLIDNMFNFSSPGEDYVQTYFKLKHFLGSTNFGQEVELVILQLDQHTFSSFRNDQYNDEYYWSKYIDYLAMGAETGKYGLYTNKWLLGHVFAYYAGREDLFNYVYRKVINRKGYKQETLTNGFLPRSDDYSKTGDPHNRAKMRTKFLYEAQDLSDKHLVEYFGRTIDLCQSLGKRLVIISYPTTGIYNDAAETHFADSGYPAKVDSLLSRFASIPYLDYRNLFFGSDTLFADSDHLNLKGANQFSRIVADTLVTLQLLE